MDGRVRNVASSNRPRHGIYARRAPARTLNHAAAIMHNASGPGNCRAIRHRAHKPGRGSRDHRAGAGSAGISIHPASGKRVAMCGNTGRANSVAPFRRPDRID